MTPLCLLLKKLLDLKKQKAITNGKDLTKEVIEALQSLAEAHGINVKFDGGSRNVHSLSMKLKFTVKENADGKSGEQLEWERSCYLYGLKAEHYGLIIRCAGQDLKLVAIASRAKLRPIIGQNQSGTRYTITAAMVKAAIESIKAGKL